MPGADHNPVVRVAGTAPARRLQHILHQSVRSGPPLIFRLMPVCESYPRMKGPDGASLYGLNPDELFTAGSPAPAR